MSNEVEYVQGRALARRESVARRTPLAATVVFVHHRRIEPRPVKSEQPELLTVSLFLLLRIFPALCAIAAGCVLIFHGVH